MAKENEQKKEKSGALIQATIPIAQKDIINNILIGRLGTNESDVVGKIISMWFYDQDWFNDMIKNKIKEGE